MKKRGMLILLTYRFSMYIFIFIVYLYNNSLLAQPILEVDQLFQNDYQDKMDNSNDSIASQGCTLTSQTMVINYALKQEGLHTKNADGSQGEILQYTPTQINKLLNDYRYLQRDYKKGDDGKYVKENGKYVVEKVETKNGWTVTIGDDGKPQGSSTSISMGALRKAVYADTKNKSFEGKGLNSTRLYTPGFKDSPLIGDDGIELDKDFTFILDQLEAGRPVVVRVAKNTHSVVISSYHPEDGKPRGSGRYDIKDPWRLDDGSFIQWLDHKDYHNLIYNYGARVYKAGGVHDPYGVPSDYYIDSDYLYDPLINPDQYGLQVLWDNHVVPEPESIFLVAIGLLGLFVSRRKYRMSCTNTYIDRLEQLQRKIDRKWGTAQPNDAQVQEITSNRRPCSSGRGAGRNRLSL